MYKYVLILLCAALFTSCDKKEPSDCGAIACTLEFRSVGISFTDKDGNPAAVKNYSAINQRTGESVKIPGAPNLTLLQGTFIVVDDSHRKSLSAEGDEIKVTGTSEATNQTKSAIVKVAGGECSCHIEKLSGPDKIAFD